jgi:hypothetical protein
MCHARSERDAHDDQIMAAAHDAAQLIHRTGAERGEIHLFRRPLLGRGACYESRFGPTCQRG